MDSNECVQLRNTTPKVNANELIDDNISTKAFNEWRPEVGRVKNMFHNKEIAGSNRWEIK